MSKKYKYDIALSFAGEDRLYVDKIANCLLAKGIKVFYDSFEEVDLWGQDLYVYLDDLYRKEARYCIMFLSTHYSKKLWTNHERRSAQARAFEQNEEYILPIKLDDTEIPGIRRTTGYLDGRVKSKDEICTLIIKKLKAAEIAFRSFDTDEVDIPKLRRKIKDSEKKEFLLKAYQRIKESFALRLEKLVQKNNHIKISLKEKSQSKFVVIIKGEENEIGCKIWIDKSQYGGFSILYSEAYYENYESNSYNDSATVEDDGYEIYFNILGMIFVSVPGEDKMNIKHASTEELSKYLWGRLIRNL